MHIIYRNITVAPSPLPTSVTGYTEPHHMLTFSVTQGVSWVDSDLKVQISDDGTNRWDDVTGATFTATDHAPKNVWVGKGVHFRIYITALDTSANLYASVSM